MPSRAENKFGEHLAVEGVVWTGLNPLVACASSLLVLGAELRNTLVHERVGELKEQVFQKLKEFEHQSYAKGLDKDSVLTARYVLCTYLDAAVMSTPWGSESGWADQSLLSIFHNETWGGEKFFQILERHQRTPSQSIDLLELIYFCLALGFKGKFGLSGGGNDQLTQIQDSLFRTIRNQRGDFERELSPHWHGVKDNRNALDRIIPLWVKLSVFGLCLLIIDSLFRWQATQSNSSIYEQLEEIREERQTEILR